MDERGSQKFIEIEERASSVPRGCTVALEIAESRITLWIIDLIGIRVLRFRVFMASTCEGDLEYFACRRYVSQRVVGRTDSNVLCRRDFGDSITRGEGDLENSMGSGSGGEEL